MKLSFERTERGLEIHNDGGFVAEVARENEGVDIVATYNKAKALSVIEFQNQHSEEWGLSSGGSNPTDSEFFPMPQETAFRLVKYLKEIGF